MSDTPQGQPPQPQPPQPQPPQPQPPHPQQPAYATPQGDQHAPTEWVGSNDPPNHGIGPGGQGERSGGGRRRGFIVGAAVAAVLLLGGGAVFAFQLLSGGGAQPDEAIPSSAIGYVRVDLDPSADQKVNALALLRRVPQFAEETGITSDTDDLRKRLFELALEDNEGCSDIDYDNDIAPWIGDRAGAAALPASDGDEPDALIALQVSDEGAAREGLEALTECGLAEGATDQPGGLAFVGDYALLAETQALADEFAAAAEQAPLSEDGDYTNDMEALDGEGIASAWVDIEATLDSLGDSVDTEEFTEAAALSGLGDISSVAMSLRANSDSLEVAVAADGVSTGFGETTQAVQTLPATTMFAFGFSGGSDLIESGWSTMTEQLDKTDPGAVAKSTADLEAATGLRLPDDLQTLFGDDFAFAVDGGPLELDPSTGAPDPSSLRVGIRTSSDVAAVGDLVTRVEAALAQFVPLDLVEAEADSGGSVIALNDAYAETLAADGDLGSSDVYRSAVADSEDAAAVYFFDFDRALTMVDQVGEDTGELIGGDERKALEVLRSFGLSASVDGDYTVATVRLVFD